MEQKRQRTTNKKKLKKIPRQNVGIQKKGGIARNPGIATSIITERMDQQGEKGRILNWEFELKATYSYFYISKADIVTWKAFLVWYSAHVLFGLNTCNIGRK